MNRRFGFRFRFIFCSIAHPIAVVFDPLNLEYQQLVDTFGQRDAICYHYRCNRLGYKFSGGEGIVWDYDIK